VSIAFEEFGDMRQPASKPSRCGPYDYERTRLKDLADGRFLIAAKVDLNRHIAVMFRDQISKSRIGEPSGNRGLIKRQWVRHYLGDNQHSFDVKSLRQASRCSERGAGLREIIKDNVESEMSISLSAIRQDGFPGKVKLYHDRSLRFCV